MILTRRPPVNKPRHFAAIRAVSQLLWPHKDREVWFSLGENHENVFRFGLHLVWNHSRTCLQRMAWLLLLAGLASASWADGPEADQDTSAALKQLSLAELGNVEVTTASKEPEEVWKTPAAVYVITQEDIRVRGLPASLKSCGWRRGLRWPKSTRITGP